MAGFSNARLPVYVGFSKLSGPLGMVTIASVRIHRPVSGRYIELPILLVLLWVFPPPSYNINSESQETETVKGKAAAE